MQAHPGGRTLTRSETAPSISATCGNCGAATDGAYCPDCGQDTRGEPPTVREYIHELADHFIHFDGKLVHTLGPLFFLPGRLSRDYLANRRERYIKPLKLYLASIAIAFAAFQFLGWNVGLRFGAADFELGFYLLQPAPPRTVVAPERMTSDSVTWVLEHVDTPGVRRLKSVSPEEQRKVTRERNIHFLPYLALVLVPVFAALLRWVYRDRRLKYAAHLVFSLYLHSFLLLLCVVQARLPLLLATVLSSWAIVYYPLALKRVYAGSWRKTIGRGALLTLLYLLTSATLGC